MSEPTFAQNWEGSFEVDNVPSQIQGRLLSPGERAVWIAAFGAHFQFRFSDKDAARNSAYVADEAVIALRSLR